MDELKIAKSAVLAAGAAIMQIFNKEYSIQHKTDQAPVTEADLLAQSIILERLKFKDYGFLCEESLDNLFRLNKKKVWVIDPLDGTKEFIKGLDEFTIMVGLAVEGEVILGCVYQPVLRRLFYAEKNRGAYLELYDEESKILNKRKIEISKVDEMKDARMLVSRSHLLQAEKDFARQNGIGTLIPCGSAGLKICLIASGEAEIYMNTSDKTFEWDICAADIILREAGGILTDLEGKSFIYNRRDPRNLKGFMAKSFKDRI